jgi:transposase InsO family protein
MPWKELSVMEQRREMVELALAPGSNKSEVFRRFGISRDIGYKWLARYRRNEPKSLEDHSRRPLTSPRRTAAAIEAEVVRIRDESNNAWGGRKIAWQMETQGWSCVPQPSTITGILRRNKRLEQKKGEHRGPYKRFERAVPNELWQMDYKGHVALLCGRCHPLTVLDDHSRYSLALEACTDERGETVRMRLTKAFRRYGLPFSMLMDNGSPWGDAGDQPYTVFTVWLMRLGIVVIHGAPYHPQTQGKEERFHRTLNVEVFQGNSFRDIEECQVAFDRWRHRYNHDRPHEALGLEPPARRYRPSARSFPESLPAIEYGPGDFVRRVGMEGFISFKNQSIRIGKAFRRQPVALRPSCEDGIFNVHFCAQQIGRIDLHRKKPARGFVDIASTMPTTPPAQLQQQS